MTGEHDFTSGFRVRFRRVLIRKKRVHFRKLLSFLYVLYKLWVNTSRQEMGQIQFVSYGKNINHSSSQSTFEKCCMMSGINNLYFSKSLNFCIQINTFTLHVQALEYKLTGIVCSARVLFHALVLPRSYYVIVV